MVLLVEKDDVDGLVNAMQYLIDHPDEMKEYGDCAHKFAEKEFN